MKVLDTFITSEVAPSLTRRVLWINPKDGALKYYDNGEWKLCNVNVNTNPEGGDSDDNIDNSPVIITLDLLHGYYKQSWDSAEGETNVFINKTSDESVDVDKTLFDTTSYSTFKGYIDENTGMFTLSNTQNQSLNVVGVVTNPEIKFTIVSNNSGEGIKLISEPIVGSLDTKILTLIKI